jgi:hypothetical protein
MWVSLGLILRCRSFCRSAPTHSRKTPILKLLRSGSIGSTCPVDDMDGMKLTSVMEIPIETSISPGSAMLGSWPRLPRKQFMASRNLFRPSSKSCSSCTQDPRCTSFIESRIASTGPQLLTSLGTRVENPKPTGYQPSRSFCVKAVWLSCGLRICGGIWATDLVFSGTGDVEWR